MLQRRTYRRSIDLRQLHSHPAIKSHRLRTRREATTRPFETSAARLRDYCPPLMIALLRMPADIRRRFRFRRRRRNTNCRIRLADFATRSSPTKRRSLRGWRCRTRRRMRRRGSRGFLLIAIITIITRRLSGHSKRLKSDNRPTITGAISVGRPSSREPRSRYFLSKINQLTFLKTVCLYFCGKCRSDRFQSVARYTS